MLEAPAPEALAAIGRCFASSQIARRRVPKDSGGDIKEATPDPIPNSEVKLLGADGTAGETQWESRTPPGFS